MSLTAGKQLLLTSAAAASGYAISRSLRFNSSDSGFLSRTPSSAGNRRTWTLSLWVKRANLGAQQKLLSVNTASDNNNAFNIDFDSSDRFSITASSGGADILTLTTTQVFRDVSAWYHILLSADTTQSTASNRLKLYVNGQQVTVFTTASYPAQNTDLRVNNNEVHYIGRTGYTSVYCNAYLADIHLIDGSALDPSSFTEVSATTGQLIPKKYTGTFTGNSFWLPFSDNSSTTSGSNVGIGKDFSGLGNYWNTTNLSVTAGAGNDSLVDTPSSAGTDTGVGGVVTGNYATINPLSKAANATLSNGNLDVTNTVSGSAGCASTIGMSSGKWYCEVTVNAVGSETKIGICKENAIQSEAGSVANSWAYGNNGEKFNSNANVSYGNSFTTGDVIGIAFDADAGSLYFYKNGTVQNSGTAAYTSLTSGPYFFQFTARAVGSANNLSVNFGQRPFAYTAPSGFKALCDTNLPAPVVAKPNTVMDVKLYTGNASTNAITGLGFSPDLVWIKSRSAANWHNIFDTVRGNTRILYSNATDAEANEATASLTSFNSDGFTLSGNGSTGVGNVNGNGTTYAAWTWDAGSSTVTNTQGSITSSVRANTSAGFSVVSFTGAGGSQTVGHGLGVTPAMIIVKNRATTNAWAVWFTGYTANEYLVLNSTAAKSTFSTQWGSTPTSTVFGVADTSVNGSGNGIIAYCFAPVAGYSNGFSCTGNGSTDGSFVYLGFRPRLILLKCSSTTGNWTLLDTAREGYNVDNDPLYPNLSNAEGTTDLLDITSNGFKLRTTDASVNSSGATYVGYAWAEAPFAYSRAR